MAETDQTVSLKEHLLALLNERQLRTDSRFDAINRMLDSAEESVKSELAAANLATQTSMESSEKAVLKAETAAEKRFEAVNEFRAQLADQQATLARKAEVEIRFSALEDKLNRSIAQQQLAAGRESGIGSAWSVVIVVATLVIATAAIVVTVLLKG